MTSDDNARLEDFGISGMTTPEERKKEYQRQSKGMSRRLREKYWLMRPEKDPEVAQLMGVKLGKRRGRR